MVPIKSDSEPFVPNTKLRAYHSGDGGNEWKPFTKGLPQSNCCVNPLCDAMSVDKMDPCPIYFGNPADRSMRRLTQETVGHRDEVQAQLDKT